MKEAALCYTREHGWHLLAMDPNPPQKEETHMTEPQRNDRSYPVFTGRKDILDRFAFHPATEVTGPKHDEIRRQHQLLAKKILKNVPPGRHQSLALTALQESMFWANAGIACDWPEDLV